MTEPPVTFPPGWIAATVAAIVIQIVLPLVLGVIVQRRLEVGWRYFAYGMLVFFVFQIITRLPANQAIQVLIGASLTPSSPLLWAWLFVTSFTAGLFEEVGRWVGYRWLMRPPERRWNVGVMYGLGHGGIESMLLIAGLGVLSLVGLLALSAADLNQLPEEQRAAVAAQLSVLATQPAWLPLLGAWERACTLAVHVSLSVTVLQAFQRGSLLWLWLAIALHTTANVIATGLLTLLGPTQASSAVITEVVVGLMALAALWWTRHLRTQETGDRREGHP
jgi:uncharacterized membrane protein YhfC